jgi:hypothetical protein
MLYVAAVDVERFPHLFEPGRIGSMQLRNRIISCPMGDRLANDDGSVSPWRQPGPDGGRRPQW